MLYCFTFFLKWLVDPATFKQCSGTLFSNSLFNHIRKKKYSLGLYCYLQKHIAATPEKWKMECDTDQFLFFGVAAIRFRSYLIYSVNIKNVAFLLQNYIVLNKTKTIRSPTYSKSNFTSQKNNLFSEKHMGALFEQPCWKDNTEANKLTRTIL